MHGLFGEIQISEDAQERRQNPARFRPVKGLNGVAELFGHRRRHLRQASKPNGSIQLRSGFPLPEIHRCCDLFIGTVAEAASDSRLTDENLSMPSRLIRNSRVEAGSPKRLAAPFGPEMRPCERRRADSIVSRSSLRR